MRKNTHKIMFLMTKQLFKSWIKTLILTLPSHLKFLAYRLNRQAYNSQ